MPSFTPPANVAANARRALDVRATKPPSQRGMTPVGIARATQLANRQPVSIETVRRMKAYFDRHEVDKQGSTWSEQGKGWQAWMGWGGDEGRTWANRIIKETDMTETKASRRHSESDLKLIRMARKNLMDTIDVLVQLGDDGADDIAEAVASTAPKSLAIKSDTCAVVMTQLLAQTVHLYYKAHAAHWNVTSMDFPQYHEFFGELYEVMFNEIDPTAEFIRALGVKAPATLMELCAMMPMDTATEDDTIPTTLQGIYDDLGVMLATIAQGIAITGMEGEFGVQNYLQERMSLAQKFMWQLRSSLQPEQDIEEAPDMVEVVEPASEQASDTGMDMGDMMDGMASTAKRPRKALADRNATPKEREAMPAGDFVIPETRNFPVVTPDDIPAAVSSWGRYKGEVTFDEFKRRLIALAKRKGADFVAALPAEWTAPQKSIDTRDTIKVDAHVAEFARKLLGS